MPKPHFKGWWLCSESSRTSSAAININVVKNTLAKKQCEGLGGLIGPGKHTHGLALRQTYHPFKAIKGYGQGPRVRPGTRGTRDGDAMKGVLMSARLSPCISSHIIVQVRGRSPHPLIKFESFSCFFFFCFFEGG